MLLDFKFLLAVLRVIATPLGKARDIAGHSDINGTD
jgi:hypothetical protein